MAQTIATGVAIFFMANFLEHCSLRGPGLERLWSKRFHGQCKSNPVDWSRDGKLR
jgi:hypothetical protein